MKRRLLVILSILIAFSCRAYAQHDERAWVDSCLRIATDSYIADTVKKYAGTAYDAAQRLGDRELIYSAVNNMAWAYYELNDFDSAIVMYRRQLLLVADAQNQSRLALAYCNLGQCYKSKCSYFDMWDCFRQAADIYTELRDTAHLSWAIRSMGLPYAQLGMSNSAKKRFYESLRLSSLSGDTVETAITLYEIGNCTLMQYIDSTSAAATDTLLLAKKQLLSVPPVLKGNKAEVTFYTSSMLSLSRCYIKLANLLSRNDFADSSRAWLDMFRDQYYNPDNLWHNVENTLLTCEIDVYRGDYKAPVRPLEQLLLKIPSDTLAPQSAEACRMLSICYKATGNYKKAYEYTVKFDKFQAKTHDEAAMRRLSDFAAQTNIQDINIQRQAVEQQRRESLENERERQRSFYILIGVAFTVLIAVAIVVCLFLYRKRRFNSLLKSASVKLAQLANDLAEQRNAEEEAKSIMIGGVEYASQIQTDTIGNPKKVRELFPDSFVYYVPRDIVSGDWYYADMVRGHKLLVNADCTGHGIPGAMLSMLGVSALKDIINKLESTDAPILPGEILDEMRILVKKSLNKTTENVSKANVDDGMDMTILIFPPDSDTMLFGGANQSVLHVHNGKVTRLKGDSNPVGNYIREQEHFTTIEVQIATGDAVYMFSDGIQDQLGGGEIRKFTLKRIVQMAATDYKLPMPEQKKRLSAALDEWAGELAQVDDRSMIGVRV